MCDKIHGEESLEVLNLPRHSWTGNVFTRQRKEQCFQETTHGQMQQRWVRRYGKKCVLGPFTVYCELALIGM